MSTSDWGLKFIRWGSGLGIAGLVTGYFPLGHYLMKDALPSCPTAPVHGHTILLSFVGMTLFGLVYVTLSRLANLRPPPGLVRLHFWLAVIGVAGVVLNGTIGYQLLGMIGQHGFYYAGPAGQGVRNLWFAIDGVFLSLYGAGSMIFLYVLMKYTAYGDAHA
jgi:heme/copper-type cytochrome/quinol oxidase subunit 1